MLKLLEARPLGHYQLQLRFSDGRSGTADLAPLVSGPEPSVFGSLRAADVFNRLHIEHGALHWPNEIDLAPEYLYFLAFRNDPSLMTQFKTWGYL